MDADTAQDGEDSNTEIANDENRFGMIEIGEATSGDLHRPKGERVCCEDPLQHARGKTEVFANLLKRGGVR